VAQLDPTRKNLLAGKSVRKFETKPISEFPPIKTEELLGRDFVVLGIAGELNAGDFGPSFVVEVTTLTDTSVGHSWLVNKASVLGRQLDTEIKKGSSAFPFETTLIEAPSRTGRDYISFAPPNGLPWDNGARKA